jgi:ceramide glucosyltransferase
MTPALLLALPAIVGLVLVAVFRYAQGRVLSAPPPPAPPSFPPVTILKPMKGVDDGLERNLKSFFSQDYPAFELILGTPSADDPALEVARRVVAEHPGVAAKVVVEGGSFCPNPKVNLLSGLVRHATTGIFLISDSNVEADPGYLKDLVSRLQRPGVGLASSLFRGTGWKGLGGALESLQLNTFVMGGVSAAYALADVPCVVGKSMIFRREDLDLIGGFAHLGAHLAEDQVCGEEMKSKGRAVVVSGHLIDNVLGHRSLRTFLERHVRWCRLRRRISLTGYIGEFFVNPTALAMIALAIVPTAPMAVIAGTVWLCASAIAWSAERRAGVRRSLLVYPPLELLRSVLTAIAWFVPFFSSTVSWRGDRLKVGPRTRLERINTPS